MRFKAIAVGTATTLAVATVQPRPQDVNIRGVALSAELLALVEKALERCAREADQQVNDLNVQGRSPTEELCQQLKAGEQTTWAAHLGLLKHEQSWPCLSKALDQVLPGRYRLHPRFLFDAQTDAWKHLSDEQVRRIVAEQGWKGMAGTIEPDLVILDDQGVIIHVYDLKFPCPEANPARWDTYKKGRWQGWSQGELYAHALGPSPHLVSPRQGVVPAK